MTLSTMLKYNRDKWYEPKKNLKAYFRSVGEQLATQFHHTTRHDGIIKNYIMTKLKEEKRKSKDK